MAAADSTGVIDHARTAPLVSLADLVDITVEEAYTREDAPVDWGEPRRGRLRVAFDPLRTTRQAAYAVIAAKFGVAALEMVVDWLTDERELSADEIARIAASHVRLPRRTPVAPSTTVSPADLHLTTEIAYLEREQQLATQLAYELAAGGEDL
jgi:hypothetical protein